MQLRWTQQARTDRLKIIRYIASDNQHAAKNMSNSIKDAARCLLDFSYQGKISRVNGMRELIVHSNYILVYELKENIITIIAVPHAARQYHQL